MNALNNQKPRLDWLQVLRGIAAVMVVLLHLWLHEQKAFGSSLVAPNLFKSGDAGVDVFFIISGFIMVFITPGAFQNFFDWASFLYRRFTRIFPPYWIVSVVLLPVWLRHPEMFNNFHHNQMDLGRSFLLFPQSSFPLVGVGWTLIHELYFYILVSFLFFCRPNLRIAGVAIWFTALWAANLAGSSEYFQGSPVLQLVFSPFSMEFQLGMIVAFTWKWLKLHGLPVWFYALLACASLVALCVAGCLIPPVGGYPDNNHLYRVAFFGLPAVFLVAAIVQVDVSGQFTAPGWAILIGDASYAIYLVHAPIVSALYKIFARLDPHPHFWAAVGALSGIGAAGILAGILFHVLIERRLITFFHKRSPFRRNPNLPLAKAVV
jgi:peptidoglycan/LPS O-acetylase OafA/YrhL